MPRGSVSCGAGVGRIGLADADTVSESNLHRQLLYSYADVGRPKVRAAMDRLRGIAPDTEFLLHTRGICEDNARDIIADYDLIVDCCDNYATRFCSTIAAVNSVNRGYLALYAVSTVWYLLSCRVGYRLCHAVSRPRGTCCTPCGSRRCHWADAGVLGSIQAAEALKVLCGIGPALDGKLLALNLLDMEFNLLNL